MRADSSGPTDPTVIFMPSGRRGHIPLGTTLLDAARQLGVEIESICGGHLTCGKCRVQVEEGAFAKHGIRSAAGHLTPPTEEETLLLGRLGQRARCRLACSARLEGELLLFVPEESRAHKQIIRKSATARVIEVAPAVRQLYVQVDEAVLGEHRGDWGRLQAALAAQWQLTGLTIDLLALQRLQMALRTGKWAVTVTLWQDREVMDVRPGYAEGIYGLAVDIGTTTVAAYLCDLRTGAVLATESTMNPQIVYGEDLMSRVSYAMEQAGGLARMQKAIVSTLNRLASQAAQQAGLRARLLHEAVLVGNTTMIQIALGIDPSELGGAPFALANRDAMDIKARDLGLRLHPSANVHILPAEAGHVGADNVAVLLAEEPYSQDELHLIVDIGTNGEIVLGSRQGLYSASSPTGPAFEGAQISHGMRAAPGAIERVRIDGESGYARFRVIGEERWSDSWQLGADRAPELQPQQLAAGICGSGIIEAVVELYLHGFLLADGRFNPQRRDAPMLWHHRAGAYLLASGEQTVSGEPILVTQADVRSIQLAKAALYAGAKLLMARAGVSTVDRILLAGAFGTYIDPRYAMILGMIPDCDLARVSGIGNAAGDGARIALINRHKRRLAQEIAAQVRYIETAVDADFQVEFVAAMHLPHRQDPFPHLVGLLPSMAEAAAGRERRFRHRVQSTHAE